LVQIESSDAFSKKRWRARQSQAIATNAYAFCGESPSGCKTIRFRPVRRDSAGTSFMNAVYTNVLIYAHDPRDPRKQGLAVSLIQSQVDGALLCQVACECLSASRKLESHGISLQPQARQ
jgi:hypothetical protein